MRGYWGWLSRAAHDSIFFLVVNIVLLNVVFGIIIDTFGELRAAKAQRQHFDSNVCFICAISRADFERAGIRFELHTRQTHCTEGYLQFMIHVWSKSRHDYTGVEQYVQRCLAAERSPGSSGRDQLLWFPIHKSRDLESLQRGEHADQAPAPAPRLPTAGAHLLRSRAPPAPPPPLTALPSARGVSSAEVLCRARTDLRRALYALYRTGKSCSMGSGGWRSASSSWRARSAGSRSSSPGCTARTRDASEGGGLPLMEP